MKIGVISMAEVMGDALVAGGASAFRQLRGKGVMGMSLRAKYGKLHAYNALTEGSLTGILCEIWAGRSHAAIGRELGVSDEHIRQIRAGTRMPGPALLRKLGLRKVVYYRSIK